MKRIGIVGAGFIAEKHAEGMKQFENLKLAGVADIDDAKRSAFAQKYGCKGYATMEDMIDAGEVELLVLCIPTHLHVKFAMEAIERRIPFLLEKPIAMDSNDAQRIVSAAREAGVCMMVGQSLRFKSEYVRAAQLCRSGRLGAVKLVYAARLGQRPTWGAWYNNPKKSGGVLYNITLHDVDYLYSLFGDVESVYAVGNGAEDIMATLKFKCGVSAVVDTSAMMTPGYPFTMRLRINGEQASCSYDFLGGENTEVCRLSELNFYADGRMETLQVESFSNHGAELSYLAECVEKQLEPEKCMPQECVEVVRVLEAIQKSIDTGEIVCLA